MDDEELTPDELWDVAQEVFDDLLATAGPGDAVAAYLSILGQFAAETGTVADLAEYMQSTLDVARQHSRPTLH